MKIFLKPFRSIIAISGALMLSVSAFSLRPGQPLDQAATDAEITRLTSKILEKSQFAHHPLDDELAGKFLDRYLDTLDGQHMVFLQSDVDEFARFKPTLAQATRRDGDSSPARVIFQRYLERLDQRAAYVAELLRTERFDFTANERYNFDRKNAPRPADLAAAQQLWRQQVRCRLSPGKTCWKERGGNCHDLDATCWTSHADNAEARQGSHSRNLLERARTRLRSALGLHGARADGKFWFGNEPLTSRDRSVPAIGRRLLQDP